MLDYFTQIEPEDTVNKGNILRRIGQSKDQQGHFIKSAEDARSWVLVEVLDMLEGKYIAEGGIIRFEEGDKIYISDQTFSDSSDHTKVWELIHNWSLYKHNNHLQSEIELFVKTSFLPNQILEWKKNDELKYLFVPIQQKFQIGKYEEKIDPVKIRTDQFRDQLASLTDGKHMTYVAFIPRNKNSEPMFFSMGTKPHLETRKVLGEQIYGFHPNHGGHIKGAVNDNDEITLLVDAGSNDLGAGTHTSLATAEMIVDNLKVLYPEFNYKPLKGRGAFGIQQSY